MTRALRAVWDFIVGDDWVTAVGVVVAGAVTSVLNGVTIWWLLPTAVVLLFTRSVVRRRARG